MSTDDVAQALQMPGKLAWGCDDLTAAYPHGSSAVGLGTMIDHELLLDAPVYLSREEEFGNAVGEAYSQGEAWSFGALLQDFDKDAIEQAFLNTREGATSGHRVIVSPGTNRAGYRYSGRAGVLVFSPEDVENHRMVVFYNACPMVGPSMKLQMRMDKEAAIPLIFVALRNGSDLAVECGRRKDLTAP